MRGFAGLIILLLIIGAIVRYWLVIAIVVGAVAAAVTLFCVLDCWDKHARARDRAIRAAQLALIKRADQQHAWMMAGDDRGVYGEYPPAAV